MKSITVAELRQNPTAALADVQAGETYVVTRHRHEIARLIPPAADVDLVPARKPGPAALSRRRRHELRTAGSVDELLADMASAW